jgi:hypothetical protein
MFLEAALASESGRPVDSLGGVDRPVSSGRGTRRRRTTFFSLFVALCALKVPLPSLGRAPF